MNQQIELSGSIAKQAYGHASGRNHDMNEMHLQKNSIRRSESELALANKNHLK